MAALNLTSGLRWRISSAGRASRNVFQAGCQQFRQSHQRSLPPNTQELFAFDRQLDVNPKRQLVSSQSNSVHLINDPPVFRPPPGKPQAYAPPAAAFQETTTVLSGNDAAAQASDLSLQEVMSLHRYALVIKRVSQMTPKGKIPTMFAMVVVGNGNGIVGLGQGKHALAARAIDKAFVQAVRDLTAVDRFENRTIWGSRKDHWGATEIEMWSRPPGRFKLGYTGIDLPFYLPSFRLWSSNKSHHPPDRQSCRSF